MAYIYKSRCLLNLISFTAFHGFRNRLAVSGLRDGWRAPEVLASEQEVGVDLQGDCLNEDAHADYNGTVSTKSTLVKVVRDQEEALAPPIPREDLKITSFNLLSAALRTEPFEVDPPEHAEFIGLMGRYTDELESLEKDYPRDAAGTKYARFERDKVIGAKLSDIYKDSQMHQKMAIYHLIRTYMISAVNGNYIDYKGDTGRIEAQKSMGITVQGLFMEPGNRQDADGRAFSFKEFMKEQHHAEGMTEENLFAYWNRLTPVNPDSVVVDRSDHRLRGMLLSTRQTFSEAVSLDNRTYRTYANMLRTIAWGQAPLNFENFYLRSTNLLAFSPVCNDDGSLTIASCPYRRSSSSPDPEVVLRHWLNSNTLQWLKDDVKVYKNEKTKRFALGQAAKDSKTAYDDDRLSLGNLQPFKCTDTLLDSLSEDVVKDAGQWFDRSKQGQHDWMKLRIYDLLTMAVRNRVLYTFYEMSFEEMMQDWPLLPDEDRESLQVSHYLLKAADDRRFEFLEELRSSACAALAEGSNPETQASRLQAYVSDPESIQPQVVLLQEADRSLWNFGNVGESFSAKPVGYRVIWPDAMAAHAGEQAALTTDNSAILIKESFLTHFFEGAIPRFEHVLRRPSAWAEKVLTDLKKITELIDGNVAEHDNITLQRTLAASAQASVEIMRDEFSIDHDPPEIPESRELLLPSCISIIKTLEEEFKKRNEIERRLLVKYESKETKKMLILGSVHFSSQAGEKVFATEVKDYIDKVLKTMRNFDIDGTRMAIFGGDLNVDPRPKAEGGNLTQDWVYSELRRQAEQNHLKLVRLTSPGPGRRSYMKKLSSLQAQVTKTDEPHGGAIDHIYVIIPRAMFIEYLDAKDPWMGSVFEELQYHLVEDAYTSKNAVAQITGYSAWPLQLPLILSADAKARLGAKAITVSSDHLPVNVHVRLAL